MIRKTVNISRGNSKLGHIPSVSLPPGSTCIKNAPCSRDCYAKLTYNLRKNVKKAWDNNLRILYDNGCNAYFTDICQWLQRRKVPLFRYHVGGDIPNQEYLEHMKTLAELFPETTFVVWTKRHELDFKNLPKNLKAIASLWPEWGDPAKVSHLTRFWVKNQYETRIPETAVECRSVCTTCRLCYDYTEPIDVWIQGKGLWIEKKKEV